MERKIRLLTTYLRNAYGLTSPVLSPIARGVMNQNYRVESSEGLFVLKQYIADRFSREEVERASTTQMAFHHAGLPTARILPNQAEELITESPAGLLVLSQFVDGVQYDRPDVPPAAARAMGETLGRLQLALAERGPGPTFHFPARHGVLERLKAIQAKAEARRHEGPVDAMACESLHRQIDLLAAFSAEDRPSPLPTQWVHGDYQETNIIFTPDHQVAAVLDFDLLRLRPRGVEVMRTFSYSFATGKGPTPAAYDFFAGYAQVVRPSEAEVVRYAWDWAYEGLTRDWPIGVRYLEPERYDPRWDRFLGPRSFWWLEHHDEVTQRLLQVLAMA